MYRILTLFLLLLPLSEAAAQRMPERSEVRRGNRQFNRGDYEKSIERYRRALEAAPGQFEATYDLGNALYKAERFDSSEQTLQQAAADTLRSDTERAEAFYNLGNAQFKQQKYKEALESYKQSLRLNPSDREAKYNYAYTKRLLDQNQNQNQDQNGGGDQQQQNQEGQNGQNDRNSQENRNDQNGQDGKDGQKGQDGQDQQDNPNAPDKQQPSDPNRSDEQNEQQGDSQPVPAGISEQEQEQMLDAIQAQEDRTQEKLKEKQGVVVRSKKNW